jgi:aldehyde:ferredoxin oxidoreductase
MKGYSGYALWVNLETGETLKKPLNKLLAKMYLGGRGLGVRILYDLIGGKKVDPSSGENPLIFATGPLTGTPAPCSGRHCVVTKSPLTGTCLNSHSGGHFGVEMKQAGFDIITITGRSKKPVYLKVFDRSAELCDASHLWGKTVSETEKSLRSDLADEKIVVSCIGPSGEHLVKISSIMNDIHRAAGRGGAGAVMGSKKLKAVVIKGTNGIPLADESSFARTSRDAIQVILRHNITGRNGTLAKYGTLGILNQLNEYGILPTRNFQDGVFEDAELISGEALAQSYFRRNKSCELCVIPCIRVSEIDVGPYSGTKLEGPEYETAWSFGAQCGVNRLDAIAKANSICNEYGVDTISAGSAIAFAMECFERGLIDRKATNGLQLRFGNSDAMLAMVEAIVKGEGLGSMLGEGVARASRMIGKGSNDFAMHVKGMELPAYDPRGAKGQGLAYATSNRGACHLRAYVVKYEVFGTPYRVDRFATSGKAQLVVQTQNEYAVVDSLVVCIRVPLVIDMSTFAQLVSFATGWKVSAQALDTIGDRIYTLERQFNIEEGLTSEDDTLPKRLLTEPLPSGPAKGSTIELKSMLKEYYSLRGWDAEGRPTKEKLAQLQLS